jgi:hypothetical protein
VGCAAVRGTLADLDDEAATVAVELKRQEIYTIRAPTPKMRKRTCEMVITEKWEDYVLECFLHLVLRFGHWEP